MQEERTFSQSILTNFGFEIDTLQVRAPIISAPSALNQRGPPHFVWDHFRKRNTNFSFAMFLIIENKLRSFIAIESGQDSLNNQKFVICGLNHYDKSDGIRKLLSSSFVSRFNESSLELLPKNILDLIKKEAFNTAPMTGTEQLYFRLFQDIFNSFLLALREQLGLERKLYNTSNLILIQEEISHPLYLSLVKGGLPAMLILDFFKNMAPIGPKKKPGSPQLQVIVLDPFDFSDANFNLFYQYVSVLPRYSASFSPHSVEFLYVSRVKRDEFKKRCKKLRKLYQNTNYKVSFQFIPIPQVSITDAEIEILFGEFIYPQILNFNPNTLIIFDALLYSKCCSISPFEISQVWNSIFSLAHKVIYIPFIYKEDAFELPSNGFDLSMDHREYIYQGCTDFQKYKMVIEIFSEIILFNRNRNLGNDLLALISKAPNPTLSYNSYHEANRIVKVGKLFQGSVAKHIHPAFFNSLSETIPLSNTWHRNKFPKNPLECFIDENWLVLDGKAGNPDLYLVPSYGSFTICFMQTHEVLPEQKRVDLFEDLGVGFVPQVTQYIVCYLHGALMIFVFKAFDSKGVFQESEKPNTSPDCKRKRTESFSQYHEIFSYQDPNSECPTFKHELEENRDLHSFEGETEQMILEDPKHKLIDSPPNPFVFLLLKFMENATKYTSTNFLSADLQDMIQPGICHYQSKVIFAGPSQSLGCLVILTFDLETNQIAKFVHSQVLGRRWPICFCDQNILHVVGGNGGPDVSMSFNEFLMFTLADLAIPPQLYKISIGHISNNIFFTSDSHGSRSLEVPLIDLSNDFNCRVVNLLCKTEVSKRIKTRYPLRVYLTTSGCINCYANSKWLHMSHEKVFCFTNKYTAQIHKISEFEKVDRSELHQTAKCFPCIKIAKDPLTLEGSNLQTSIGMPQLPTEDSLPGIKLLQNHSNYKGLIGMGLETDVFQSKLTQKVEEESKTEVIQKYMTLSPVQSSNYSKRNSHVKNPNQISIKKLENEIINPVHRIVVKLNKVIHILTTNAEEILDAVTNISGSLLYIALLSKPLEVVRIVTMSVQEILEMKVCCSTSNEIFRIPVEEPSSFGICMCPNLQVLHSEILGCLIGQTKDKTNTFSILFLKKGRLLGEFPVFTSFALTHLLLRYSQLLYWSDSIFSLIVVNQNHLINFSFNLLKGRYESLTMPYSFVHRETQVVCWTKWPRLNKIDYKTFYTRIYASTYLVVSFGMVKKGLSSRLIFRFFLSIEEILNKTAFFEELSPLNDQNSITSDDFHAGERNNETITERSENQESLENNTEDISQNLAVASLIEVGPLRAVPNLVSGMAYMEEEKDHLSVSSGSSSLMFGEDEIGQSLRKKMIITNDNQNLALSINPVKRFPLPFMAHLKVKRLIKHLSISKSVFSSMLRKNSELQQVPNGWAQKYLFEMTKLRRHKYLRTLLSSTLWEKIKIGKYPISWIFLSLFCMRKKGQTSKRTSFT